MVRVSKLSLMVIMFLTSCRNEQGASPSYSLPPSIDSFTVKKINSYELHNIKWINNDSIIVSYVEPVRRQYAKSGITFSRIQEQEIKSDADDGIMCTWIGKDGSLLLAGDKKIIYRIDSSGTLLFKSYLPDKIPGLDSNYLITASRFYEMEVNGDTIIARIGSKGTPEISIQYSIKAPNEVAFKLMPGDTALYLSQGLPKPPLSLAMYPVPGWNYKVNVEGETYLLYTQIDSVYKKDRNGRTSQIPLNNKGFIPPIPFDINRFADNGYRNSYASSYFNYDGFIFNERTGHFIVFYRLPLQEPNAQELLTYEDQILHAMVLDKNFKPVKYVALPRHTYYALYFNVKNGIAIPREDKKTEDEKSEITFDVFDL